MTDFRVELRDRIADVLADMEPMFDRRCRLTFVMRAPHLPDGDLIVTGDDIPAVIKALERLKGYEPVGGAPSTMPSRATDA